MNYKVEGGIHHIELTKNEMLILVSLVHEGLENLQRKASSNSWIEVSKYDSSKRFVDDLNQRIMRS